MMKKGNWFAKELSYLLTIQQIRQLDLVTLLQIIACKASFAFTQKYGAKTLDASSQRSMFYASTLTDGFYFKSIQDIMSEPRFTMNLKNEAESIDEELIKYEIAGEKRAIFLYPELNGKIAKLKATFESLEFKCESRQIKLSFDTAQQAIKNGK